MSGFPYHIVHKHNIVLYGLKLWIGHTSNHDACTKKCCLKDICYGQSIYKLCYESLIIGHFLKLPQRILVYKNVKYKILRVPTNKKEDACMQCDMNDEIGIKCIMNRRICNTFIGNVYFKKIQKCQK